MLETAPSFSIYSSNTGEEEKRENGLNDEDANLLNSLKTGDHIDGTVLGSDDFSFVKTIMDLDLIKEEERDEVEEQIGGLERPVSPPMYLASGLGIKDEYDDVVDFSVDRENSEEYRELLEEYPNHPMVLRKYAKFLQSKGYLEEAEYYYFRATQADPSDGEVMSEYAKLLWEIHRDREKASTYFEHATQAAPGDSNVLAAYARFLWEIEDDGQDKSVQPQHSRENVQSDLLPSEGIEVSTDSLDGGNTCPASETADLNESAEGIENYYTRMIGENPSDPRFLKAYAQFLYKSKGDIQHAEEYYSRAILADPLDGEVLSQYAQLLWEHCHDQVRALDYFERAVQASPGDSNVLAAYARFLWIIDDEDVLDKQLDTIPQIVVTGCAGAITT